MQEPNILLFFKGLVVKYGPYGIVRTLQFLGGRLLKLAGTDVVSDNQSVPIEKADDDALRDFLVKMG
jgi:hypothetical protein